MITHRPRRSSCERPDVYTRTYTYRARLQSLGCTRSPVRHRPNPIKDSWYTVRLPPPCSRGKLFSDPSWSHSEGRRPSSARKRLMPKIAYQCRT